MSNLFVPIDVHTRLSPAPTVLVDSPATSRRLPPLASPAAASGALSPAQRRTVVVAIAGLHLLAVWGLLQVKAVRDAAEQVVPILVSLLAPPAQPAPAPMPPQPQPPRPEVRPRTLPTPPRPQPTVVAATPTPTPAAFAAPEPPADTPPAPVSAAPVIAVAEPSPMPAAPATAPAPRMLPDAAVQYLELPQVEYPKLSQRRAETGLVIVRAYVGTAGGAPHSVQVERSSGHARLDQAALTAVQRARFKPYAERGQPVEGWALIPIRFELEK